MNAVYMQQSHSTCSKYWPSLRSLGSSASTTNSFEIVYPHQSTNAVVWILLFLYQFTDIICNWGVFILC